MSDILMYSELESLRKRVKELEAKNAKLSSTLSRCQCWKNDEKIDAEPGKKAVAVPECTDCDSKRYIALKVMYFGQRFYGFACEAHSEPTVESEIFKALKKAKLLVGDKKESQYQRCGRTDKGVSSDGQVISLFVRSMINEEKESDCEEIDYVKVLNRALPIDIRVLGWSHVPIGFSARFSCSSREYKYLFWSKNMNILAMEDAGKRLIGEHDFRNFCKMDARNVHSYTRRITSFKISYTDTKCLGNQLCTIEIKGSAFLWHQVRCIVAVLFMSGQGLESADVINTLLDIDKMPRKPQYIMASEIPLVLMSCEFDGVNFICSPAARRALCEHLENECQNYQLQAAIFHEALSSCLSLEVYEELSSSCNRVTKKVSHVGLMSRCTEPTYEERRPRVSAKEKCH